MLWKKCWQGEAPRKLVCMIALQSTCGATPPLAMSVSCFPSFDCAGGWQHFNIRYEAVCYGLVHMASRTIANDAASRDHRF